MKKKYFFVIFFLVLTIFFVINASTVNAKMYKILDSEGNVIRLTNNPTLSIKEKEAGYTVSPPPGKQEFKQVEPDKVNNYNFLNTTWGMSREDVKKIEKAGFKENVEDEDLLQYKGKMEGLDCYMNYSFEEGRLVSTFFIIPSSIENFSKLFRCYLDVQPYLKKKYGRIFTVRSLAKDNEDKTSWDTSLSKVDLFISNINKDWYLIIDCKSKSEPELNP